MRLVTYRDGETVSAGVLIDDEILPAAAAAQAGLDIQSSSVRVLLESLEPDTLARLGEAAPSAGGRLSCDAVTLMPPVPDPQKVICLGLNYRDHAAESGQEVPQQPLWFGKFANSLIGDGAPVSLPAAHPEYVDHEAELAVVIGRPAHDVSAARALEHVAGAMPFNDVSARDLQLQNQLWTSGKAIDSFAPCGPALVTLDEIGDLQGLALRSRINGELIQEGTTSEMIFGIAETIAWLSRTMTLLPGDIIATGTPAGVGATKGKFLRDGDTMSVEVERLGILTNPVVSSQSHR
jgi:2-keto-4-pentenoate hydratase/2-oxohepta-3-ene-1,7-dioic acid hydratase in catechol pathway